MSHPTFELPEDQIATFCRKWKIAEFSLFGSVLSDRFRPDSDVDVLVEWEPGHTPGWDIVTIAEELEELFGGRKVDMINPKFIKSRLRDNILNSAEVQYEREG